MAVNTPVPDEDLKVERELSIRFGITPQEGKEVFDRVLSSSFPQVVVSTRDFSALQKMSIKVPSPPPMEETAEDVQTKPSHARPDLSSVFVVPGNQTEQTIADIWQKALGLERVGIHDNFFELGGHSLLVAQVITRLREAFSIDFPMEILFEKPTVHLLSTMILEEEKSESPFMKSINRGRKRKEKRLKKNTSSKRYYNE